MSSLAANFVPYRCDITAVTQAQNANVTTSVAHGYENGQWVRIIVPLSYGMDISYVPTQVSNVTSTTFDTDIDTSSLLPFVVPSSSIAYTSAQVVPITGTENNLGLV